MTTTAEIRLVFPHASEAWLIEIVGRAPAAGIDTKAEMATFLAQCGHESRGFTRFEEDLNYSAGRLMQVWPLRFPTIEDALPYAHNPMALGERVYGGRLGNTDPGDGWAYRGRGCIQCTGKRNYSAAGEALGLDLLAHPDWVCAPSIGVQVALWYWRVRGLDAVDDDEDARAETRLIQGGSEGLDRRQASLDRLLQVLA